MAKTQVVHGSVWALLSAITGVNPFDSEVPKTPPLDEDGRVHAYAVLYFSPGRRHANAMDGNQSSVDGSFQVTCVGGDPDRALWCVDKVLTALVGAAVTIDGVVRRVRLREEDPGTVRRDDDVTPVRHYVPLRFQLFMP
jgi:hypothetical protein